MKENTLRRSGFTLIELLVVIAIIAILAGILLPVLGSVFDKMDRTRAQTQMQSIVTACKSYYAEYGIYPIGSENGGPDTQYDASVTQSPIIRILRALESGISENPRGIGFITAREESIDADGAYVDPWGQPYGIAFDSNFDTVLDTSKVSQSVTNVGVAVWSLGNPQGDEDKRELYSWK